MFNETKRHKFKMKKHFGQMEKYFWTFTLAHSWQYINSLLFISIDRTYFACSLKGIIKRQLTRFETSARGAIKDSNSPNLKSDLFNCNSASALAGSGRNCGTSETRIPVLNPMYSAKTLRVRRDLLLLSRWRFVRRRELRFYPRRVVISGINSEMFARTNSPSV